MDRPDRPEWEKWYDFLTRKWNYGKNAEGRSGMDMGPMTCPGCDGTEFQVERGGYQGEFHIGSHNLRALCVGCKSTLVIAVRPILISTYGNRYAVSGSISIPPPESNGTSETSRVK